MKKIFESLQFLRIGTRVAALSVILAGYAGHASFAYELYDPAEVVELKRGIYFVFTGDLEKSQNIFLKYIKKHPERPEGYFLMACRYAEYMNAYRDRTDMAKFKMYAKMTIKKSNELIRAHPDDPTGYFFIGNLKGYTGMFDGQDQNWVQAFMDAVAVKKNLEKALELDPTLYDCYFALGTIYYYASKKQADDGGLVGYIIRKFITNNGDMRSAGIRMIEKAVTHGNLAIDSAKSALLWVNMSEENYEVSERLASELGQKYPRDRRYFWAKARIGLAKNNCASAMENFNEITKLNEEEGLGLMRLPEVQNGQGVATMCLNLNVWKCNEAFQVVKDLQYQVSHEETVWLEYPNANKVINEWTGLLYDYEKAIKQKREKSESYADGCV